jgi:hypothetical protein
VTGRVGHRRMQIRFDGMAYLEADREPSIATIGNGAADSVRHPLAAAR